MIKFNLDFTEYNKLTSLLSMYTLDHHDMKEFQETNMII